MPSAQETTRGRARRLLRPPWSALGARLHKRTGTHTKAACLVEGITAQIAPPLRAHRSLYFILLDSTAMLSHCLLYHGEASQKNDQLTDRLRDPNINSIGVSPSAFPAISRRLRHHQSSTVILDYSSLLLAMRSTGTTTSYYSGLPKTSTVKSY